MPNKIDDFVPYRLLVYVESRLRQISTALGYNCDPYVTDDLLDAVNNSSKHRIFYEVGPSVITEDFVGGRRTNPSLTINVTAVSKYETENPRRLAMSLEQDVRTAIQDDFSGLRDDIGRGFSMRFGRCAHDNGNLEATKEAWFELALEFKWSQSSDW